MKIQEICDTFALLGDDWQARYAYIIELGGLMEPFPESARVEENKVNGCVSQVWLTHCLRDDGSLQLRGESDSQLVKGLVAIVLSFYADKTPFQIASDDSIAEFLKVLKLQEGLTPQRSNGLRSLISSIRQVANGVLMANG